MNSDENRVTDETARSTVFSSMCVVLRTRERSLRTDWTDERARYHRIFSLSCPVSNHKQKWRLLCLVWMCFAIVDVFAFNCRAKNTVAATTFHITIKLPIPVIKYRIIFAHKVRGRVFLMLLYNLLFFYTSNLFRPA